MLISHSSKDAALAKDLHDLIERASLKQIQPWFSSDKSAFGGIGAGDRWFDRIRKELHESSAVIVLVTPNSTSSAWVHFEAGFGAANSDLEIIPLVVGIEDFSIIPNPITHWQMYRAARVDDCVQFAEKLFGRMEVHFDRELVETILQGFASKCQKSTFPSSAKVKQNNIPATDDFLDLRHYLDQKFFDLAGRISTEETNFTGYGVEIENPYEATPIKVHIDLETSFNELLNEVYYQIADYVGVYKYMVEWVLTDADNEDRLIVREIGDEIPARILVPPFRKLVVTKLQFPYSGTDSHA